MVWNDLCEPDAPAYDAKMTKNSAIRDPVLRFLHRLITSTISGRRESTGVVSQRDLFYLHCFRTRQVPHLGYGFALYMTSMSRKKKGALCGGPYITRLAKGLGVFNSLRGLTIAPPMIPFDIRIMRSMGLVTKQNGQYIVAGQPPVGPPQPPPVIPSTAPTTSTSQPKPAAPEAPPAPTAPTPVPSSSHPPIDSDDLHSTLYEIHHTQRYHGQLLQFHGAQLSWFMGGLQQLCQAQSIQLPPQPALHDFLPDADSDTDDTEPLPEDEDAVDVVPAAPADDEP